MARRTHLNATRDDDDLEQPRNAIQEYGESEDDKRLREYGEGDPRSALSVAERQREYRDATAEEPSA